MANLNSRIELLKDETKRIGDELSRSYCELGEAAFGWHSAINYPPSQQAYENLFSMMEEKRQVEERINALKGAVLEVSDGDREIALSKNSIKEMDRRYNTLIASLGAVAIEADAAGRLDSRLQRFLSPMEEYESRLSRYEEKLLKAGNDGPAFIRNHWERKIERLKLTLDDVFAETGRKIYGSGDFRNVPGDRARSILDEMEEIRQAKKEYRNNIKHKEHSISQAQSSLADMGAYGVENRHLRELQSQLKAAETNLENYYIEYGMVLADGMTYWLDPDAPKELLQCCQRIIRQTEELAEQSMNLELTSMEREIEMHNAQNSVYTDQMNHLNAQIQTIENQKAEIQIKIDAELKAISELRMRQNELSRKMGEMEWKNS